MSQTVCSQFLTILVDDPESLVFPSAGPGNSPLLVASLALLPHFLEERGGSSRHVTLFSHFGTSNVALHYAVLYWNILDREMENVTIKNLIVRFFTIPCLQRILYLYSNYSEMSWNTPYGGVTYLILYVQCTLNLLVVISMGQGDYLTYI